MKTTIDINEQLIKEAMALTGVRTKRQVIQLSLQELVAKEKRDRLRGLLGQAELTWTLPELEQLRATE